MFILLQLIKCGMVSQLIQEQMNAIIDDIVHRPRKNERIPTVSTVPIKLNNYSVASVSTDVDESRAYHHHVYENTTLKAFAIRMEQKKVEEEEYLPKDPEEHELFWKFVDVLWCIFLGIMGPVAVYFEILIPTMIFVGGIAIFFFFPELWILGLIGIIIGFFWLYSDFSEMEWWQILLTFVLFAGVSYILHLIFGFENVLEVAYQLV